MLISSSSFANLTVETLTENFDLNGDKYEDSIFSVSHTPFGIGVENFSRSVLSSVDNAPTNSLLPISINTDKVLKFGHSQSYGISGSLMTNAVYSDVVVDAVVGLGFSGTTGSTIAEIALGSSSIFNEYVVMLITENQTDAKLLITTRNNNIIASISKIEIVSNHLVETPIDLSSSPSFQDTITLSSTEYSSGAVSISAYGGPNANIYFDDIVIIPESRNLSLITTILVITCIFLIKNKLNRTNVI